METAATTAPVADANSETGEEGSSGIVDATAKPAANKAAPKEAPKPSVDMKAKLKAKVYDKEEEVTVEDLLKTYQKERAADEKFRRASEIERKYREMEAKHKEFEETITKNPWKLLEDRGINADEVAERRLLQKMQWEMMSDEQKAAEKTRQENETLKAKAKWYEEQETLREKELAERQREDIKLKHVQEIDSTLSGALKERGMKPTPAVLESVAQYMLAHLNSDGGKKDITPVEALDWVIKQSESDFFSRLEGYDVNTLMDRLSGDFKDAIRKWYVGQVTNGTSKPKAAPSTPPKAKVTRQRTDDFFKKLEQKYG